MTGAKWKPCQRCGGEAARYIRTDKRMPSGKATRIECKVCGHASPEVDAGDGAVKKLERTWNRA